MECFAVKNMTQFGNDLLDMLSEDDRDALSPLLEEVHLRTGYIIAEPGNIIRFSYFPRHDSLVAYLIPMPDGETVECSMIGREGAVGSIVSRSALPAYARCCVHHGGDFFRISVNALEGARGRSPGLNNLLSRQADCLIAQLFQSIACNARHSIEQRTARWLCAAMNHIGSKEVPLTQAQLGGFLGAWLGGRIFELTGAYDWVWYIDVVLAIGAALVHLPIREQPLAPARTAAA